MDATQLVKNAPWIFALSIVGVLGCLILLAVGLNLYARERDPRKAARPAWRWPAFLQNLFNRRRAPAAPSPAGAAAGAGHEVLRVLRHPLTGRLIVEIAGRRYQSLAEVDDPEAAQGLHVTLRDLQRFVGVEPAAPEAGPALMPAWPAAPAPAPPPAAPPLSTPTPADIAPPAVVLPPAEAPTPAELPPLNPLPPPAKPAASGTLRVPSMNPFRQIQILRELGSLEPAPPSAIAEQIDDVLQQLISGTPFATRELKVQTGPQGGVIFAVDGASFTDLAAIPDAAAQAVFREAIRQWEAR